jgi:hypothetical protein
MTYRILSDRIGTVGDIFEPKPGTNIQALLFGGFIEEVSTPKPKPSPKVKKSTKE